MSGNMTGKSVAILLASGFSEDHLTEIQKALTTAKAKFKTVAPEQGVVNGWQKTHWGHYFSVDTQIGDTLGSDFDFLVVIGGERSVSKLKSNLHTKRIVNHFFDAGKPVSAIGEGVELLAGVSKIAEMQIAIAAGEKEQELKNAGAIISENEIELYGHLLTATDNKLEEWAGKTIELFSSYEEDQMAA